MANPEFRRSSYCDSGACVEVAQTKNGALVKDAKNPDGPVLSFKPDSWKAFTAGVQQNVFSRSK